LPNGRKFAQSGHPGFGLYLIGWRAEQERKKGEEREEEGGKEEERERQLEGEESTL
jgi:hypothetical protein